VKARGAPFISGLDEDGRAGFTWNVMSSLVETIPAAFDELVYTAEARIGFRVEP
jgi:hypothetical protein